MFMKRQLSSRTTIHDVATAAGVSVSTVSFVLNNRPGISDAKTEAVLKAAKRLNYKPDRAAQELSSKAIKTVGLSDCFGGRRLGAFSTYYRENLFRELQLRGFRPEELPTRSDGLPERFSDLVVLTGLLEDDPRIHYLREHDVPFIVLGHAEEDSVFWVAQDNYGGSKQATEHLLRLGHKHILFVSGSSLPRRDTTAPFLAKVFDERYRGYKDALKGAGLTFNPDFVIETDYTFTTLSAYRAVVKAIKRGLNFSGVFAISDDAAIGVIAALEDASLHVPKDVSVVGFDDMPEVGEGLTTIRQNIPLLAASTVELVQEALERKEPRHIEIPVQLIVRGTTARKRG
jgi:LacI family transcriptional regulator